jgi:hypothetical protein
MGVTMSNNTGFSNSVQVNESLGHLAQSLVKVIHGTADGMYPLANHTVAAVRNTFAQTHNIPEDAVAFVNGAKVDDDYIIEENSTLEFIKQAGRKG